MMGGNKEYLDGMERDFHHLIKSGQVRPVVKYHLSRDLKEVREQVI